LKRRIEKLAAPLAALIAGAVTPLGFAPYSLAFIPFLTLAVLFLIWLRAGWEHGSLPSGRLGLRSGLGHIKMLISLQAHWDFDQRWYRLGF